MDGEDRRCRRERIDSAGEREERLCRRDLIDGAGEIGLIVQKSEDRQCRREIG